jgi:transcriptional regulator with XRE-family HTH domain
MGPRFRGGDNDSSKFSVVPSVFWLLGTSAMGNATHRNFGEQLRWWRKRRGMSQLELAGSAGTSQRHLSFLESGRAAPSQPMVLSLAAALNLSVRQQNTFLTSAGYAAMWREGKLGEPELAQVDGALDYVLAQQEPFPAFVVDRHWNLKRANKGAVRLVEFILGEVPQGPVNLADALLSPAVMRPFVVNWEEVALHFIRGVQADAIADGSPESSSLLTRLLSYDGLLALSQSAALEDAPRPLLPIHLRKSEKSLHLFTTIATLGTPQDITVQEIRIENFFPMDEPTARFFREPA